MSKFTDAADAISRAARQFEHMKLAEEVLREIGSMENARNEAAARLQAMGEQEVEAQQRIVLADAEVVEKRAHANELVRAAEEKAKLAVVGAEEACRTLTEAATTAAAGTKAAADAYAESVRASLKAEKEEVDGKVTEANDTLAAIGVDIAQRSEELAGIEARLAAAREAAARMLAPA